MKRMMPMIIIMSEHQVQPYLCPTRNGIALMIFTFEKIIFLNHNLSPLKKQKKKQLRSP